MSVVIRIPSDLYERLESHADGFDTPAGVIKRILDFYEGKSSVVESNEVESNRNQQQQMSQTRPELVFHPSEDKFWKNVLREKKAYVRLHKFDGTIEQKLWNAKKLRETSDLRGNIWSNYLRDWNDKRIVKAEFSVNESDFV